MINAARKRIKNRVFNDNKNLYPPERRIANAKDIIKPATNKSFFSRVENLISIKRKSSLKLLRVWENMTYFFLYLITRALG